MFCFIIDKQTNLGKLLVYLIILKKKTIQESSKMQIFSAFNKSMQVIENLN